jgi:two-component system, LytTR family, response regulator
VELKVLICDDELGMRTILKKAVLKIEGFQVVGEAADGEAALSLVEDLRPQIVFMDVEMPKIDGLECAKRIMDINPKIIIIFATGHNEFMSDAFQLYAFDYIVKPFKIERVFQTLERVKALNSMKGEQDIFDIIRHEKGLDKILIKNKEGVSFIDVNNITIIQREERSTVIYTIDGSYITSEGLSELEERLDNTQFFRSHKSYIVNLSMLSKIYPYGRWTYIIKLKNTDKDALLTHEKYGELKDYFSKRI